MSRQNKDTKFPANPAKNEDRRPFAASFGPVVRAQSRHPGPQHAKKDRPGLPDRSLHRHLPGWNRMHPTKDFRQDPDRNPWHNTSGRSSDSFRFRAFPVRRPVAKDGGTKCALAGRNSQQRVLSQNLTAFPFHSSRRSDQRMPSGNLCRNKYRCFFPIRQHFPRFCRRKVRKNQLRASESRPERRKITTTTRKVSSSATGSASQMPLVPRSSGRSRKQATSNR